MSDDRPEVIWTANAFAYLSFAFSGLSLFVAAFPLTFVAICLGTTAINRASVQETSKQVPMASFFVAIAALIIFALLHSGLIQR